MHPNPAFEATCAKSCAGVSTPRWAPEGLRNVNEDINCDLFLSHRAKDKTGVGPAGGAIAGQ